MDEISTCTLCFESFTDENRPRVLSCGHTYCSICITKLMDIGSLQCPSCQHHHMAASVDEFPINYTVEQIIRDFKKNQIGSSPKVRPNTQKGKAKIPNLISNQKDHLKNLVLKSNGFETQIKPYHKFLQDKKEKHEKALKDIHEVAAMHEDIIRRIDEEIVCLVKMNKEREEYCKNIHEKISVPDPVRYEDAVVFLAELMEIADNIEECMLNKFPDVKISSSEEFLEKSLEGISMALSVRCDVPAHIELPDDATLMEKVQMISSNPTVTVNDLHLKPDVWKKHMSCGLLSAIHSEDGHWGQISVKEDKVFLHCLQQKEHSIPAGFKVNHDEILKYVEKTSVTCFMDLSWNGRDQGRIQILLHPNNPFADQFRILCTGEKGFAYRDINFIRLVNKGTSNEHIVAGDYSNNDGTGGKPILDGLNVYDKKYRRKAKLGTVLARTNNNDRSDMFFILTAESDFEWPGVFGQITEGMGLLSSASKLTNIEEVKIVDCGVIVPL